MTVIDINIDAEPVVTEQTAPAETSAPNRTTLIYRLVGGGLGATLLAALVIALAGHPAASTSPATTAAAAVAITSTEGTVS
jgi:hypothetical protein